MSWILSAWIHYLSPVIDILLIAFVFYRLLLLIKGTHAVQIIFGLALLMVATLLVRDVFSLRASAWIMDRFWASAVIVLAVVFQPELRALLAQLGSHPLGRLIAPTSMTIVDEIMGALEEASQRQMGVLVVLELDVGLRNYADTGTFINGEVSKELLMSIFHYRSPLHDGAVIIQQGRLVAAGCLLPLSNDPSLAKILGTRHRAAVGLSEFTDAWVLVVSEETGTLSLARGGRLERNLSLDHLRTLLTELYVSRERRGLKQ